MLKPMIVAFKHVICNLDFIVSSNISYPLFVPRIRKGTHLKESVFPEAEG